MTQNSVAQLVEKIKDAIDSDIMFIAQERSCGREDDERFRQEWLDRCDMVDALVVAVRAEEWEKMQTVLDGFSEELYDEQFGVAVGLMDHHLATRRRTS